MKSPVRYALLIAPFPVFALISAHASRNWDSISTKLHGRASDCPWTEVLRLRADQDARTEKYQVMSRTFRVADEDPKGNLELIETRAGRFWIPKQGKGMKGPELLGYLLADHDVTAERSQGRTVRAGDVVIDCGAHVGVFGRKALAMGASLVVAVEIDPTILECLRRNFAAEIKSGRVIVYPKGVWDQPGTVTLQESNVNSGMNSAAVERDGERLTAEVTTLDRIVEELKLDRVNLLKMDIEGAERRALKGASALLAKHHPRLMLDSYHLPDDPAVFRSLLAPFGYKPLVAGCTPCDQDFKRLAPNVTFWE